MKQQAKVAAEEAAAPRLANEAETAEYIADLLSELQRLAASAGLVQLQYFILQAQDEAKRAAAA
jgi:hypothetical protein